MLGKRDQAITQKENHGKVRFNVDDSSARGNVKEGGGEGGEEYGLIDQGPVERVFGQKSVSLDLFFNAIQRYDRSFDTSLYPWVVYQSRLSPVVYTFR